MMITSVIPPDWRALQEEVGRILGECGFVTEVEKKVKTARGSVKLDVYAEEEVKGKRYSIVCECKHWKSKVPQSVIHGFRTVLNDLGVNCGYIVSMKGFQSGSEEASSFTNVKLVQWDEFQKQFCATWLERFLSPTITRKLDALLGFTEPLVQRWMCEIPTNEVFVVKNLREKYMRLGIVVMAFTTYSSFLRANGFPKLPLRDNLNIQANDTGRIPDEVLDVTGYREFMGLVLDIGHKAISEFEEVRRRNIVRP